MTYQIQIGVFTQKVLEKEFYDCIDESGAFHIDGRNYHLASTHNLSKRGRGYTATINVVCNIALIPDSLAFNLYKFAQHIFTSFVQQQVSIHKMQDLQSIRLFYAYYDLDENDFSYDASHKIWTRFKKEMKVPKNKFVLHPIINHPVYCKKTVYELIDGIYKASPHTFYHTHSKNFNIHLYRAMFYYILHKKYNFTHSKISGMVKKHRPSITKSINDFEYFLIKNNGFKSIFQKYVLIK